MNKSSGLIVFVRAPVEGTVKTRLQPEISPTQSLALYRAVVDDLLSRLQDLKHVEIFIFFSPEEKAQSVADWLGREYTYSPQPGEDLGDRMSGAIVQTLRNCGRVLLIGSDIPDLGGETIRDAFTRLDSSDIVIGPSEDGGYYLIGMKQTVPELFIDMVWSEKTVFSKSLERARKLGLRVSVIETMRDIDTFEDVLAVWQSIRENRKVGKTKYPNLFKVLADIME